MLITAVQVLRIAALLALLSLAVLSAVGLERRDALALEDEGRPLVYLPSATVVRLASLGHANLAADYFWLQGLQYYGAEENRPYWYRDLHKYLELAVDLDPDFEFVYRFGGTAVPYNTGRWSWVNVPQAEALLSRGLERFPDNWVMWMQLGFVRGIVGTDYEGAAQAYASGAAAPGSPPWLPRLATRLYATAGSLEAAEVYAEQILSSTTDPELRETMEQRMLELQVEARLQRIDEAMARYVQSKGAPPESVDDLVRAGLLDRVPEEPLGGEFLIEGDRAITTSFRNGRLRVFEERRE